MWLLLKHREIARRPCESCLKYLYDESTGEIVTRLGRKVLRSEYGNAAPPPCRVLTKNCPKGTPERPKSLWPENQLCYDFYRECKAVNRFPNDPLFRQNVALIQEIEKIVEKSILAERHDIMIKLVERLDSLGLNPE